MSTAMRNVSVLQRMESTGGSSCPSLNHAGIGGVEYLHGEQKVSKNAKLSQGSV
jgi:hypothetical protein